MEDLFILQVLLVDVYVTNGLSCWLSWLSMVHVWMKVLRNDLNCSESKTLWASSAMFQHFHEGGFSKDPSRILWGDWTGNTKQKRCRRDWIFSGSWRGQWLLFCADCTWESRFNRNLAHEQLILKQTKKNFDVTIQLSDVKVNQVS